MWIYSENAIRNYPDLTRTERAALSVTSVGSAYTARRPVDILTATSVARV
jgi:hypothetical protein